MLWIILGVIVLVVIVWFIATYNKLIALRNTLHEAFSTMDVYLKKRHDLIPNLVNTVKGFADHEQETLTKVLEARNMATTATTTDDRFAAEAGLSSTLRTLFAVAENYPELRSNSNFMDLQKQLQTMEGEIAQSRKYYNGAVKIYNTKIQTIPSNLVASMFRFKEEPYFEAADSERENVTVSF